MKGSQESNSVEELRHQIGKRVIDIAIGKNSAVFVLEDGATILIRGNPAGGLTITSAMHASELNSLAKDPLQRK